MSAGQIPDTVEVYRHKCLSWVYLVANQYDDIPDSVNVYFQDSEGVVHDYKVMTVLEVENMVRDEHWIFVKKLRHEWFNPIEGGMTAY